ncbi:MAG: type I glutamate--ammonia ligase [Bacilli bacterium]|jgi:glutamine synthetase|nr:type I glutamate--ammonia ligase [Bacilli bacterium]MDD3389171.1 type I glutamate--ammonia ligase [Bacilli bacterium]MDD4344988.1 type I glutamate--ammonia ligase [Bacilli bacterium]MDD4521165.1 type I glutamate--ammonia ligase [Bacilli bacterium]MDY0399932.1 type I glutamate--ammonia ligase [Bacilli bacterium]
MAKYTKKEILEMAAHEGVLYIRLQFTDMLGTIKAVEIPTTKLPAALDGEIMFDGSSIEGFVRIKEADMYLRPDFDTWLILNFEDISYGKVARLICDVYTSSGEPFWGDPRYILKKAVQKLNAAGYATLNIGFEPEFFLFKIDEKGNPTITPNDAGGYFDMAPIDGAEYARRDITLELEKLGFIISTSHHEVAAGQHEINFRFADVVSACDNVQTFKQVVKVVARRHHLFATFMPKPFMTVNGSGMHTNMSLADLAGNNIFYDQKDPMKLSLVARKWISGVLKHARGFAAITNPVVNSYKRLIPGYEAPCYACWSDANRSALIRIPAVRGESTRAELRNVDPTANPYLALAVILMAGLEGISANIDPLPPVYDDIFALTREEREQQGIANLPENLKDAIKEMKADPLIRETLGDHTYHKYIYAKELEWDEYRKIVTNWELDHYLHC